MKSWGGDMMLHDRSVDELVPGRPPCKGIDERLELSRDAPCAEFLRIHEGAEYIARGLRHLPAFLFDGRLSKCASASKAAYL